MRMYNKALMLLWKYSIGVALFVFSLTLFLNDGFIGTDEYWTGISRYVPAQTSYLENLVSVDDVKSPTQLVPFFAVSQLSLKLGFQQPYDQYRFTMIVLGLLNFFLFLWAFSIFFSDPLERKTSYWILAFHAVSAFVLTRPMFESITAPWLTLFAAYLYRYDQQWKYFFNYQNLQSSSLSVDQLFKQFSLLNFKNLVFALMFFCIAFLLRPQVALCSLGLLIFPILHKDWRHLKMISIAGVVALILTGLPDLWLRGQWHFSIFALADFNLKYGHQYGGGSWINYVFLLLLIAWAPFLFLKSDLYKFNLRDSSLLKKITNHRHIVLYTTLVLFVFLHSLFAQKFERFMIPLVPLILVLITPRILYFFKNFNHYKIRLSLLLTLNMPLFFVAAFFPSQKNLIDVALYLNTKPEIQVVYHLKDIPEWIPEAFILNKNFQFEVLTEDQLKEHLLKPKEKWLAKNLYLIPKPWLEKNTDILQSDTFKRLPLESKKFSINWVEALAYRWNPQNNARRIPLISYQGRPE